MLMLIVDVDSSHGTPLKSRSDKTRGLRSVDIRFSRDTSITNEPTRLPVGLLTQSEILSHASL